MQALIDQAKHTVIIAKSARRCSDFQAFIWRMRDKIYPEIAAEIKARTARTAASKVTAIEHTNLMLREENSTLQQSIADLISENAGLLFRASAAEERIKALEDRISRLEARQGSSDRRLQ